MENLSKFETDLWEAADNLRANSKLTSSDYFMPVLGIIFLRHAANRFDAATKQIDDDQVAGRMPKRKVQPADYIRRRALWLPETARYDGIMAKATIDPAGLPKLVTDAMTAIEADFEPLANVLPKDYGIFEPKVLEELMRLFNSEQIKHATGDVFGRIYEYFLAKFSIQKAHDNGEFFTPSSLVQLIVNVIEPDHGNVFDPACGSGGMFVQSSHFIEHEGGDTTKKVVFYGQEKNRDTIRIAKMNLAVHGLEGKIAEAITYYQDEHNLAPNKAMEPGSCDFVMANPPFNVDLVDAERIKKDPRLPFGLPGVNKDKRVSNGNYLWISYFFSYLSDKGRAGFVMSSQASSAGNDEKTVRQKLVETGGVDVMISIKSGFFYTRTVPCELWHFDRNKPADRKDRVLMLDARNIGQLMKGSRKVHEFTPEQMRNITAIVWLYRGQRDRFKHLLDDYREKCRESRRTLAAALAPLCTALESFGSSIKGCTVGVTSEFMAALASARAEVPRLDRQIRERDYTKDAAALPDLAVACKGVSRLARQIRQVASPLVAAALDGDASKESRKALKKAQQDCDAAWQSAVDAAQRNNYFTHQIEWLEHRFPKGVFCDVPGLCRVVKRKDIEAADWSLTPGRYVGVAPAEVDEDFDFEQTITNIHTELAGLNTEATALATTIQKNFQEVV